MVARTYLVAVAALLAWRLPAGAVDSTTVLNEVMYHPARPGGAEWIELHNQMAVNMDLSEWQMTGGVNFTFPAGTVIKAGGYLLVASDAAAVPGSIGPWTGSLDNDGETIRLRNVSGRLMDELDYRDSGRWPVGADGSGATLAKRDEGSSGAEPEAWVASVELGGTPGTRNQPASPQPYEEVRISEIAGTGDAAFRVELQNEAALSVSLEGMRLGPTPLPTITLAPGAFVVFDETQLGFRPSEDDRLFLYGSGGATLLDAVVARQTERARWHGRMLVPSRATFGSANVVALAQDIVINEIMYHFPPTSSSAGSPAVISSNVLVPLEAVWRYNRSNIDLGVTWAQTAHPPGGDWLTGQALLGFETTPASLPDALRTPFATSDAPTYYFETDFTLTAEQIAEADELRLEYVIDDGAAFYINGIEIGSERFTLPAGPLAFSTLTTAGVDTAVLSTPRSISLPGLNLQPGLNRLSVEVHQQLATDNDMICGVRLSLVAIQTPAVPPRPISLNPEEWIELHNPGQATVSLAGWKLDGAVEFTFPPGTSMAPGGFLVVARESSGLKAKWPEVASSIIGDFSGALANSGERIELEDAAGNPADAVRYIAAGWSDGGGSSLELRDPRSDNANPAAWADSDETGKSAWEEFTYRTTAGQRFGPTMWNEMRLGLLDAGVCLIDDVSVKANPDGAATERMQNGDFETLPTGSKWRLLGNHRASAVIEEPGNPANHVLRLEATGPTETNHNHAESTFLSNQPLSTTTTYEVSLRARWLAGTNQLNTRAYYQKLARTHALGIPAQLGTPGSLNSRHVANAGPTISALAHAPRVPPPDAPVMVSFAADDPDGVGSATLHYRANGEASFTSLPMIQSAGLWSAEIPGRSAGAIVQFYVEAVDALGAVSFGPAKAGDSRALIQWADNQGSSLAAHQLRLIMLTADRNFLLSNLNRLSNERLPGTLVYRGNEVFYDVGVRLQGTAAGRVRDGESYVGYDIGLPPDHLFRGVHPSIGIDRSGRAPVVRQQHEIFVRHTFHRAGIPCALDDLCHFIAPQTIHTGTAILQLASYDGLWAESQFDDAGTVFNYDITYDPTSTSVAGNAESPKPPVPFGHVSTDLVNLGDDKEQYRGPFDIRAGKRRDNYTTLITLCKTMALPNAQLATQAPQVLDLDEVMRCTALVNLWGIADTYFTGGLAHNIRLFAPDHGTGINFLPWDLDFVMTGATNSAIIPGGNNLGRLISGVPAHRRRYLGHVRHLCATAFTSNYLTPWLTHYGSVVGQNFSGAAGYITARRTFAATQYPAQTPYAITTNGGADFAIDAGEVVLDGTAWIDVHEIRRAGSLDPLAITWPAVTTWRAELPLSPGANTIALEAYDFDGALIATRTVVVTSSIVEPSPRDFLRMTEVHYHPAGPETPAEAAAGPADGDFEFLEVKNIGVEPLRLNGVHFGAGADFAVPDGTVLAGGHFAVIVRNRAAFEARYGTGITVLGDFVSSALSNDGETITLLDATGAAIQSFTFADAWFPSTDGPGWSMVVATENAATPDLNSAAAWRISFARHGNPGAPNGPIYSTEFEGWRHQHFTSNELADPLISSADATPGGLSNRLRYALGLTPTQPASAGLPTIVLSGAQLDFSYRRPQRPLDLQYLPESSIDLETWAFGGDPISTTSNADGTETVIVRFPRTPPGFVRLRVTFGE